MNFYLKNIHITSYRTEDKLAAQYFLQAISCFILQNRKIHYHIRLVRQNKSL